MKKQFAIIGLGRFGSSVCRELFSMNHEVLAIDNDEEKIDKISPYATHTVVADGIDEKVMSEIGIRNFDHVIVGIGEDIQASILCTLILIELGVKNVWVKAQNDYHHKVLEKIGAHRVFRPEKDMGNRIAEFLTTEKVIDFIDLSADYSIIEIQATNKVEGKSLVDLDASGRYSCNILAIKQGKKLDVTPQPNESLHKGDILVVVGNKKDLRRFQEEEL